jgi:hypothetical protein
MKPVAWAAGTASRKKKMHKRKKILEPTVSACRGFEHLACSVRRSGGHRLGRSLFFMALLMSSAQVLPAERVTEGKFYSCLSTQWLDDLTAFAVSNDIDNVRAYLEGNKCLLLKPDLPVTIAEGSSVLGPRIEFLIKGIRFYAPSEEIAFR